MAKKIPDNVYEEIRELAGAYDVSLREYSGRNMNGQNCLGLTGELQDLVRFSFNLGRTLQESLTEDEIEACNNMFSHLRMDDMGRDDVIFYFPGWEPKDARDRLDTRPGMGM